MSNSAHHSILHAKREALIALISCSKTTLIIWLLTIESGLHFTIQPTTVIQNVLKTYSSGKLTLTSLDTPRTPKERQLSSSARTISKSRKPLTVSNSPFSLIIVPVDIWHACANGQLDVVRILLREGQRVDQQSQFNENTPLHIAARNGHFLIAKYLIENQANPTITNKDQLTPNQYLKKAIIEDNLRKTLRKGKKAVTEEQVRIKQKQLENTHELLKEVE